MKRTFFPQTIPRRRLIAASALGLLTLLFGLCAAPPHRALQLWSFTILWGMVLLLGGGRLPWRILSLAGFLLSWADLAVRGFLWSVYEGDPRSSFVIESVANTNPSESLQFLSTVFEDIAPWAGAVAGLVLLAIGLFLWAKKPQTEPAPARRTRLLLAVFLGVLMLIFAAGGVVRPWRSQWPVFYWPQWAAWVGSVRQNWENAGKDRERMLEAARSEVLSQGTEKHTLVLVIGESVSRDQMSLYGYGRDTTPQMKAWEAEDPRLATVRHVWALSSSTLPALNDLFDLETPHGRTHLFVMLKAAGYRVTWLSNQDDLGIKSKFAAFADRMEMINTVGGRSSTSLDENLLEPFGKALAEDTAPKRVIVLHTIGIHPHYRLRYPAAWEPGWGGDVVTRGLKSLGRSDAVIRARDHYDTAMRYQDQVLSDFYRTALAAKRPDERLDWLYISDHAQELGDNADRTGHSYTTNDGFRVPLLIWSSDSEVDAAGLEARPFRADRFAPFVLSLLNVGWRGYDAKKDFLSEAYVWEKPELPAHDAEIDRVSAEWKEKLPQGRP